MAALYTQQSDAHQINNLISLGQPVLGQYADNESKINNHINVYSYKDMVQRFAGTQTSFSALIGGLTFGLPGYLIGNAINYDQTGIAGREVPGANNQNATLWSKGNWVNAHADLYQNNKIWNEFISGNIK